jgi:hypothetical protein
MENEILTGFIIKKGENEASIETKNVITILKPNHSYIFHRNTGNVSKTKLFYVKEYSQLYYNPRTLLENPVIPFVGSCLNIEIKKTKTVDQIYFKHDNYNIQLLNMKDIYIQDYNCYEIYLDEESIFKTYEELTYSKVIYGEKYYKDYVMNKNIGEGVVLKSGSAGRIFIRTDDNSSGHILIGKIVSKNKIYLCGFKIKKNTGIYIQPGVLYSDDFLKGEYNIGITNDIIYKKNQLLHIIHTPNISQTLKTKFVKLNFIEKIDRLREGY